MGDILGKLGLGKAAPTGLGLGTGPMTPASIGSGMSMAHGAATPPPASILQALTQPSQAAPQGAPMDPSADNSPINVTADGWKPHKKTLLGALADGWLVTHGQKPLFTMGRDEKNVQEALAHFGGNPDAGPGYGPQAALRRLMQIPGHQKDGMEYYNQMADNRRADAVVGDRSELNGLKFGARMGGMLNAVGESKDPAANYARMLPNMQAYAKEHGLPELPDKYDEDSVHTYVMSNVDADSQLKMAAIKEYRNRSLGIRQEGVDNTKDYRDARLGQMDVAEAGKNTRAATAEAGRNTRSEAAHPVPKVVKTPNGDMTLSTTGNRGMIGDQKWEKTGPGKWKKVD